jgi:hemerythrin-like domain-containing protein
MEVIRNAFDYVNLLREHIIKEDNVLFPMADQVISADSMQVVSSEFDRILAEDTENGTVAKYEALVGKLDNYLHGDDQSRLGAASTGTS